MKCKTVTIAICLLLVSGINAQTLSEGIKLFKYERPAAATGILRAELSKNPADIEALYWLARVQLASDAVVRQNEIPVIPDNLRDQPWAKVTQGIILLTSGDTLQPGTLFAQAVGTARKKNPAIQLAIAEAMIDAPKGNILYALNLLNEAEKRDRKNPAIFLARGDAYRIL